MLSAYKNIFRVTNTLRHYIPYLMHTLILAWLKAARLQALVQNGNGELATAVT